MRISRREYAMSETVGGSLPKCIRRTLNGNLAPNSAFPLPIPVFASLLTQNSSLKFLIKAWGVGPFLTDPPPYNRQEMDIIFIDHHDRKFWNSFPFGVRNFPPGIRRWTFAVREYLRRSTCS